MYTLRRRLPPRAHVRHITLGPPPKPTGLRIVYDCKPAAAQVERTVQKRFDPEDATWLKSTAISNAIKRDKSGLGRLIVDLGKKKEVKPRESRWASLQLPGKIGRAHV